MTITISRTELARNTRRTIERARREGAVLVESYGEEQVVIQDAADYRLVKAYMRYQGQPPMDASIEPLSRGLTEEALTQMVEAAGGDIQVWWDQVVAAHQRNQISLGRAAVLLNTNRFELIERYNRLSIPLQLGPRTLEEARAEVEALRR